MINLFYDLHIHSCLSPCGSDDMTPYNIVGMAALKGLDVIAVTDHNSCKNCPAVTAASEEYGVLTVPGMEINTSEEVHALCLFKTLESSMEFDSFVYKRLLPVKNREDIFGKQEIYDCRDQVCGHVENLLINSTDISFDDLWELVGAYDGVMIPAHIDKASNSLISNLGFVPEDSRFTAAEVADLGNYHTLKKGNPYLEKCRIISDSDAHYLEDIHEPRLSIAVEERTVEAVVEALKRGIY